MVVTENGQRERASSAATGARRRLLTAAAVLVGIGVCWTVLAFGAWGPFEILRPADRFGAGPSGEANVFMGAVAVEETVLIGMVHSMESVRLDSVEVHVDDSSPVVLADVVACRRAPGMPTAGGIKGEPLRNYCQSVHSPTGIVIGPTGDGGDVYILAAIQPLEPGRVFVDGVTATHSGRLFSRSERTGSGVEMIVG